MASLAWWNRKCFLAFARFLATEWHHNFTILYHNLFIPCKSQLFVITFWKLLKRLSAAWQIGIVDSVFVEAWCALLIPLVRDWQQLLCVSLLRQRWSINKRRGHWHMVGGGLCYFRRKHAHTVAQHNMKKHTGPQEATDLCLNQTVPYVVKLFIHFYFIILKKNWEIQVSFCE